MKRLSRLHILALLATALLPSWAKAWVYRRFFGWRIVRKVKVGFSVLLVEHVTLGDGVRIGHFNLIKDVRFLEMGQGSHLHHMNHVFGPHYPGFPATVRIGARTGIMSRHFIDAAGEVEIGEGCTLGGRGTHVWSHTIQREAGERRLVPMRVAVGDGAYVGARATLVGCVIPDGCVVGAGAVVVGDWSGSGSEFMLAGNPAKIKKRYGLKGDSTKGDCSDTS